MGTGIKTNGIGKRTTAHLNLTHTMVATVFAERSLERKLDQQLRRLRKRRSILQQAFAEVCQ